MPIIPATQEVEMGGSWFKTRLGEKLLRLTSQQTNQWYMPLIPATWEAGPRPKHETLSEK
jgi:hypothetical protein